MEAGSGPRWCGVVPFAYRARSEGGYSLSLVVGTHQRGGGTTMAKKSKKNGKKGKKSKKK